MVGLVCPVSTICSWIGDFVHMLRGRRTDTVSPAFRSFLAHDGTRTILQCAAPCITAVFPNFLDVMLTCPSAVTLSVASSHGSQAVPMPPVMGTDVADISDFWLISTFRRDDAELTNRCELDRTAGRLSDRLVPSRGSGNTTAGGCTLWRSDGALSIWDPVAAGQTTVIGITSIMLTADGYTAVAACNTSVTVAIGERAAGWTHDLLPDLGVLDRTVIAGVESTEVKTPRWAIVQRVVEDGPSPGLYIAGQYEQSVCGIARLDLATGLPLWQLDVGSYCTDGVRGLHVLPASNRVILINGAHELQVFAMDRGTLLWRHYPESGVVDASTGAGLLAYTELDLDFGNTIDLDGGSTVVVLSNTRLFAWRLNSTGADTTVEISSSFDAAALRGTDVNLATYGTDVNLATYHDRELDLVILNASPKSTHRQIRTPQQSRTFLAFNTSSWTLQWNFTLPTGDPRGAPSTEARSLCARVGEPCTCTGEVWYGANGGPWTARPWNGTHECDQNIFCAGGAVFAETVMQRWNPSSSCYCVRSDRASSSAYWPQDSVAAAYDFHRAHVLRVGGRLRLLIEGQYWNTKGANIPNISFIRDVTGLNGNTGQTLLRPCETHVTPAEYTKLFGAVFELRDIETGVNWLPLDAYTPLSRLCLCLSQSRACSSYLSLVQLVNFSPLPSSLFPLPSALCSQLSPSLPCTPSCFSSHWACAPAPLCYDATAGARREQDGHPAQGNEAWLRNLRIPCTGPLVRARRDSEPGQPPRIDLLEPLGPRCWTGYRAVPCDRASLWYPATVCNGCRR